MGPSTPTWQWGNGLGGGTKGDPALVIFSVLGIETFSVTIHTGDGDASQLCLNILEP